MSDPQPSEVPAAALSEIDNLDDVDPYSPGRLFAVAVLGAFSSLLLYYTYQQMEPDYRRKLRKGAVSLVKGQVRNFVTDDDVEK